MKITNPNKIVRQIRAALRMGLDADMTYDEVCGFLKQAPKYKDVPHLVDVVINQHRNRCGSESLEGFVCDLQTGHAGNHINTEHPMGPEWR